MTAEINTCPNPTLADYMAARAAQGPTAIIPCAGEPIGIRDGQKMVYASNGTERGWYCYDTDLWKPER